MAAAKSIGALLSVAAVIITLSTPLPLVNDLVISAAFSSLEEIKALSLVPEIDLSLMS